VIVGGVGISAAVKSSATRPVAWALHFPRILGQNGNEVKTKLCGEVTKLRGRGNGWLVIAVGVRR
jgi:hypothetical protein